MYRCASKSERVEHSGESAVAKAMLSLVVYPPSWSVPVAACTACYLLVWETERGRYLQTASKMLRRILLSEYSRRDEEQDMYRLSPRLVASLPDDDVVAAVRIVEQRSLLAPDFGRQHSVHGRTPHRGHALLACQTIVTTQSPFLTRLKSPSKLSSFAYKGGSRSDLVTISSSPMSFSSSRTTGTAVSSPHKESSLAHSPSTTLVHAGRPQSSGSHRPPPHHTTGRSLVSPPCTTAATRSLTRSTCSPPVTLLH